MFDPHIRAKALEIAVVELLVIVRYNMLGE